MWYEMYWLLIVSIDPLTSLMHRFDRKCMIVCMHAHVHTQLHTAIYGKGAHKHMNVTVNCRYVNYAAICVAWEYV